MFSSSSGADRGSKSVVVEASPTGLGTFGGVFTPSILTILGVIMYLRFGWVLANVGLIPTLVIVTLSTSITLLTALSIAAIATDERVRTGGAYYMISRSLGIETGGAVGIPLFIAQALSVALYTLGFAESVVNAFPALDEKMVALVTTVLVAVLALVSAAVAIRAQYFIMAAIGLSLLSLIFGGPVTATEAEIATTQSFEPASFWVVFAVFFPAVTGIMAGVNMSGDLKNPSRSIPKGTFAAIGVGYAIYMTLPILLSAYADDASLLVDPLVMRRIAIWGDAILLGVWGATLSSALGSILGAPRVLQALARDNVLPRRLKWLGVGSGVEDTPRAGTVVTLGVALAAVYLGDLNLIAPVLTMFFLTTYGVLNVAAGTERFLQSPSFRPTFRVHWSLSLLGAVGCVAVMFLINAAATVVATIIVLAIYFWLERRELQSAWGDVRYGIWMAITRAGLLRLRGDVHPKNWRPQLLVLSGAPTRRWHLVEFANALIHGRGLMTVCTIITEDISPQRRVAMEENVRDYLAKRAVQSLVRVVKAPDAFTGAERLVDAYGLGALVPNTVLLGASDRDEDIAAFTRSIAYFHAAQRNIIVVRQTRFVDTEDEYGDRKKIHVWWGGLQGNGSLMLIIAYLLQTSMMWQGADVRLFMVVPNEAAERGARANIEELVELTRTGAEVELIVADGTPFADIIPTRSSEADLVILGMAPPTEDYEAYYRSLIDRTSGIPATAFVLAAENVQFSEVLRKS